MIASAAAALALVISSTAGAAAPPSQPAAQQAQNPWMTLSMMTPVAATSLGAAGVAAQPPGEPPPEGDDIPLPIIIFWLGTIGAMIYIALNDDKDPRPTQSPD